MSGKSWGGGKTPGGRFCNVFKFRDGRISSLHIYLDPDYTGEDEARFRWVRAGNGESDDHPSGDYWGAGKEFRRRAMSNSISNLMIRNLRDVFGENDPVRRRAAIDEIWAEAGAFYDPK